MVRMAGELNSFLQLEAPTSTKTSFAHSFLGTRSAAGRVTCTSVAAEETALDQEPLIGDVRGKFGQDECPTVAGLDICAVPQRLFLPLFWANLKSLLSILRGLEKVMAISFTSF